MKRTASGGASRSCSYELLPSSSRPIEREDMGVILAALGGHPVCCRCSDRLDMWATLVGSECIPARLVGSDGLDFCCVLH